MSYKTYTDKLEQVLKACKIQNINANMKKLQDDIVSGICIGDIIENLYKYI
jgi:predicted RNase H-like nuclease (RuvC/YqgF family)